MASGFAVEDLGVDVPLEKFIEGIKQPDLSIFGLSALLTIVIDSIIEVINLIKKENLRSKVRIIVGGSAFNIDIAQNLDVDAYGMNPKEVVNIYQKFLN